MLTIAEANVDSVDPGMLDAIRAEALRAGAASDVQPAVGLRYPWSRGSRSNPGPVAMPG